LTTVGIKPIPDEKACKLHYSNLNNALGAIHRKWKNSGNGDEQVDGALEESESGRTNLDKLPTQGGDRLDFLGNFNISVMYLWYV